MTYEATVLTTAGDVAQFKAGAVVLLSGQSALDVPVNFSVATSKLTVNASTGAAVFAGAVSGITTLKTTGDLFVGTATAPYGVSERFASDGGANTAIVGKTSTAANAVGILWTSATSGDNIFAQFAVNAGGNLVGNIDFNRGATATRYNTSSDATLKTLLGDAPQEKSVSILKSTRLREYYWNEDATKKPQIGPFAQELYETYKGAVSVGGEQEDGTYRPWGVDKTAFSFHLVAGWQNHESRIAELAAKVAVLEAK